MAILNNIEQLRNNLCGKAEFTPAQAGEADQIEAMEIIQRIERKIRRTRKHLGGG
jgi:hypothetical protein